MVEIRTEQVIQQKNIKQVQAFFQSERNLDINSWSSLWAEAAIRRTPFAPEGFPLEIKGKSSIIQALKSTFEQAKQLDIKEEIFPTNDPSLIIARTITHSELKNGIKYSNEVIMFFRFDDDHRIIEWTGYMNPFPILELMKEIKTKMINKGE